MFEKWRIKVGINCLSDGERYYYEEGIQRQIEEAYLYSYPDENRESDNRRNN